MLTVVSLILQELLESISSLKKEVMELKKQDTAMLSKTYPKKCPCNGENNDRNTLRWQRSRSEGLKDIKEDHNSSEVCILLEEGKAFMETMFGSKLEYKARKTKVAKYGKPDAKWLKFPKPRAAVE